MERGNGVLAFDAALGALEDPGGGYLGRFGPWVVGVVADGSGHLDLGASYQRPAGNKDYRFAVRASDGSYRAADGSEHFRTTAAHVVGEIHLRQHRIRCRRGLRALQDTCPAA